jgi:osmotically-inducible protein OsmY
LLRTITLPVRLTYGVSRASARTGYAVGRRSARATYKATRRLGIMRMFFFGAGVAVGLLIAPVPGEEMRERIRRWWEERQTPPTDADLADRVRTELAQSPRTWHLPQPQVEVVSGKAILTGDAPHASGKDDIERAVAAVPGVTEVDNRLVINAAGAGNGTT